LEGLGKSMKARIVDIALALLVLIYQVMSGHLSLSAWRKNAWITATPWVWLVCCIATVHIIQTAITLGREMKAEMSPIEIPGRPRSEYPVRIPYYGLRIWSGPRMLR
jgi:hypothetical protein